MYSYPVYMGKHHCGGVGDYSTIMHYVHEKFKEGYVNASLLVSYASFLMLLEGKPFKGFHCQ